MESTVFIVGVGRSGTSLLHAILNAHPQVYALPEIHYVLRYLSNTISRRIIGNRGRSKQIRMLQCDPLLRRLDDDLRMRCMEAVEAGRDDRIMKRFFHDLMNRLSEKNNCSTICVKDPNLIDYVTKLNAEFRGCKVVHIVRDPRDVVLSRSEVEWGNQYPLLLHALIASLQIRRLPDDAELISIKYEQLVENTESTVRRLLEYLGLPWDESLRTYHNDAGGLVSTGEPWKHRVTEGITTSRVGRWKDSELSTLHIVLIELVCDATFDRYGYAEMEVCKLPGPEWLYRGLAAIVKQMFAPIYYLYTKVRPAHMTQMRSMRTCMSGDE